MDWPCKNVRALFRRFCAVLTAAGAGNGGTWDGGAGGSGIVIIRYPSTYAGPASTTGSPTVTNTGGYKIYKWISSGSITF